MTFDCFKLDNRVLPIKQALPVLVFESKHGEAHQFPRRLWVSSTNLESQDKSGRCSEEFFLFCRWIPSHGRIHVPIAKPVSARWSMRSPQNSQRLHVICNKIVYLVQVILGDFIYPGSLVLYSSGSH